MSAVWRAARAAVGRRRLQTCVIALVVLCSTTTVLLALAVLDSASAPFDRAFERQRGAHAVAAFDAARASVGQLAATARRPGVLAAAGPFREAVVEMPATWLGRVPGPLTVVGRADPAGPVDRVDLLVGRWATAPGEIVVNWSSRGTPDPDALGTRVTPRGGPPLTVVGFAGSMSKSAGAWVAPGQIAALHPQAFQMLYRFTASATDRQVDRALAAATRQLPSGALREVRSSPALRSAFAAQADSYLPFMAVFGVLGLVVSVLIVGNVVSGAVVSGYRHIGVLKALGFTPNQVVAVYLTMVLLPAAVGGVLGTLVGTLLGRPVLSVAFSGVETGSATIGVSPWVPVCCLLGMPVVVAVAALLPALRARRLPAARAIAAGSAPRTGRGLRVQRALSGARLPRPISLGLGLPFTRPGRSALIVAAIGLGVATVTLATGLSATMIAAGRPSGGDTGPRIEVQVADPGAGPATARPGGPGTRSLLRSLPGAERVGVRALLQVSVAGDTEPRFANFYGGDVSVSAEPLVAGRRPRGPDEMAAGPSFLAQHGLSIGDRIVLRFGGRQVDAVVVGELMSGNARSLDAGWSMLDTLAPGTRAVDYTVRLTRGTDTAGYARAVTAADPGLRPSATESGNSVTATVIGFSSVFSLLLTVVTALGVFNTVLLNVRERRRDVGVLKSIGMTPRQVVVMTVTSVTGLGLVGGLLGIPLGITAHRMIVDNVTVIAFPEAMKDVWHVPQLGGLALAGVVIAVLGALLPARHAARLTIARVLHSE